MGGSFMVSKIWEYITEAQRYSKNVVHHNVCMTFRILAELAPGGPELGTAQPKLV